MKRLLLGFEKLRSVVATLDELRKAAPKAIGLPLQTTHFSRGGNEYKTRKWIKMEQKLVQILCFPCDFT